MTASMLVSSLVSDPMYVKSRLGAEVGSTPKNSHTEAVCRIASLHKTLLSISQISNSQIPRVGTRQIRGNEGLPKKCRSVIKVESKDFILFSILIDDEPIDEPIDVRNEGNGSQVFILRAHVSNFWFRPHSRRGEEEEEDFFLVGGNDQSVDCLLGLGMIGM